MVGKGAGPWGFKMNRVKRKGMGKYTENNMIAAQK